MRRRSPSQISHSGYRFGRIFCSKGVLPVFSALVLALVLISPDSSASSKSYYHPDIEIIYTFLPDGTAEVEELRSFKFNGSFSWAELEKETFGDYGRYGVEFLGVWDAQTGLRLASELSSTGRSETIKWYYSANDETKRFRIRYRITGAVQRYYDAAQFYWKAIGDSHMYVGRVRITIIPPGNSPRLFKVFIHSSARPGTLHISDTGEKAEISQSDIPANTYVEIRALLDPDRFPEAALMQGESHATLLEDEKRVTEEWRRQEQARIDRALKRARQIKHGLAISAFFAVCFIAVYIWVFIRYGTEPKIAYDNDYEREPPRKIPPCVLPAILSQSKASLARMSMGFAATLLEAARLGYLEITEKEKKVLLFKDSILIYTLTNKGMRLLGNKPLEIPEGERRLIDFEVEELDRLFREAGDGRTVTSKEIEKWASEKEGTKTKYYDFIKDRAKSLREDFESTHFKLDDETSEKAKNGWVWFSLACGFGFVLAFLSGGRNPVYMVFGPIIILVGSLISIPLARRSPEAAVEYNKWDAFKKFMSDFSAMKEAGPSLLPMWEEYLVYAVALGVADKLLSNLKLVASEYNTVVPAAVWFRPGSIEGAGAGHLDSMAAFESLSSSISNMTNLSSALSSSSSGGGGFSGGGGGGGGGGGCGAG